MKKIINVPENYTDDMLKGIYLANKQVKYVANDLRCYCIADKKPGKVAIVTGGGTGHIKGSGGRQRCIIPVWKLYRRYNEL